MLTRQSQRWCGHWQCRKRQRNVSKVIANVTSSQCRHEWRSILVGKKSMLALLKVNANMAEGKCWHGRRCMTACVGTWLLFEIGCVCGHAQCCFALLFSPGWSSWLEDSKMTWVYGFRQWKVVFRGWDSANSCGNGKRVWIKLYIETNYINWYDNLWLSNIFVYFFFSLQNY